MDLTIDQLDPSRLQRSPYSSTLLTCQYCNQLPQLRCNHPVIHGSCCTWASLTNGILWKSITEEAYANQRSLSASFTVRWNEIFSNLHNIGMLVDLAEFRATHTAKNYKGKSILPVSTYYTILFLVRRHLFYLEWLLSRCRIAPQHQVVLTDIQRLSVKTYPVFEDRIPRDIVTLIFRYCKL